MWLPMWSSGVVYILAMYCRSTSLESQLSFWDYPLAWRVIASEWFSNNTPVGGHGRKWKTIELVTRNYWWLGVMKEVEKYMDRYDAYQRYKNWSEAPAGKLMPNTILEKPWNHISVDFITKLPLAQRYNAILVVCDWFSKMVYFIAITERTSAEGLAKLFQDHI